MSEPGRGPRFGRRVFCVALASPLLAPALSCRRPHPPARDNDAASRPRRHDDVAIDVGTVLGAFDRLSGVQGSPAPLVAGEPDFTDAFRAHHIARARIDQDCPPNSLTLAGIFPDDGADPDAPSSYRFEAIDRHIGAARAAGAEVLWQSSYDVGGSDRWVGPNLGGRPPRDLDRWGRVIGRCLDHFNRGWAGGMDHAVRFVEFLNEPDGLGGFSGADRPRLLPTFLRFLAIVDDFNRAHPEVAVRAVGPGVPLSLAEWPTWRPRFEAAARAIASAGRPLPVFSFHTYGDDTSPRSNGRLAGEIRAVLDAAGLRDTELWNTEWLAGDFLRRHLGVDDARAAAASADERRRFASAMAAYAVACKIRWQGVLTGSFYYRANRRAFPSGHREPSPASTPTRFFSPDGTIGPLALQESLTEQIQRTTPLRCPVTLQDDGLLTVLGLRTEDARRVALLASNLDTEPRRLRVALSGAPEVDGVAARLYRLDGARQTLAPEQGPVARRSLLELTLPALTSAYWIAAPADEPG